MKGRNLEVVVNNQDMIIDSLKSLNAQQSVYFNQQLASKDEDLKDQKEITGHVSGFVEDQRNRIIYLEKGVKKHKREKKVLGVTLIIVIILSIVK